MKWFDYFCQVMGCADGFRKPAEAQLGRQFRERTGLTLSQFAFAPPREGAVAIAFEKNGTALLRGRLHGPDAYSFEVSLGWRRPGWERPLPSDTGPWDGLEIWWQSLPADSLRAHYAKPSGPPWPVSADFPFNPARYPFEVEWEHFSWPSLTIGICTGEEASADALDRLTDSLEQARLAWNTAAEAGGASGLIHNLGTRVAVTEARSMQVDVDFGSAGPKALVVMLDTLRELAAPLAIRRVRLSA